MCGYETDPGYESRIQSAHDLTLVQRLLINSQNQQGSFCWCQCINDETKQIAIDLT